ncbi:MAG: TolC family protein [Flammeovirgaceae bacterium]|nr:TolC family protein [Flammeovirgaceae bacterium]
MRKYILLLFGFCSLTGFSQSKLSVEQAIDVALQNNIGIKSAAYEVESQKQLKKTSFDLPKTNVSLLHGQYNSYAKNDNNFTITQSIPFAAFGSQALLIAR